MSAQSLSVPWVGIIEDAVQDLEFLVEVACKQANSVRSQFQHTAAELVKYMQKGKQEETA